LIGWFASKTPFGKISKKMNFQNVELLKYWALLGAETSGIQQI
jgi:hypothetical protein